jgi:hypothetical protein
LRGHHGRKKIVKLSLKSKSNGLKTIDEKTFYQPFFVGPECLNPKEIGFKFG